MKTKTLIGAILFLWCSAASASYTGNQLHAVCDNTGAAIELGCSMYILGAVDMHGLLLSPSGFDGDMDYCPPNGATAGQAFAMVRRYLDDKPERRHLPAAELILDALKEAFPCDASE